nr:RNA-directed DNA polymerase, eukaryota, reverse transcriptase zinc-binding domain protein [Tanacetum cinerariifolium]
MSQKVRSFKQQVRVWTKFGDHVVGTVKHRNEANDTDARSEEIRVENDKVLNEWGNNVELKNTGGLIEEDNVEDEGVKVVVVVFDEALVEKGSEKWEMVICGYFVGYRMTVQELNYHLYRMWFKLGLSNILPSGNGVFVFKINSLHGLNEVLEKGSWMVNNKPMVVQRWNLM